MLKGRICYVTAHNWHENIKPELIKSVSANGECNEWKSDQMIDPWVSEWRVGWGLGGAVNALDQFIESWFIHVARYV